MKILAHTNICAKAWEQNKPSPVHRFSAIHCAGVKGIELGNLRGGDPFILGMVEGSRKGCNMTKASGAKPDSGSNG